MPSVYEAVKNQDAALLRECLKRGGNADDCKGALVNACETGVLEIVDCFLDAGVFDSWAVVAAARFGHAALVERLLKVGGGDVNAALIAAAAHNRLDAARVLVPVAPDALDAGISMSRSCCSTRAQTPKNRFTAGKRQSGWRGKTDTAVS